MIKLDPEKKKNFFIASWVKRQPLNFCIHFSEKAPKGRRRRRKGDKEGARRRKGEEEKKSNGCTISFYDSYFEDKVIKNPARYI